jgi:hypothetical protein
LQAIRVRDAFTVCFNSNVGPSLKISTDYSNINYRPTITLLSYSVTSRNAWHCSGRLAAKIPGAVQVGHRNCLDVVEKRNTFLRQQLTNHVPRATVFIRSPHCWGVA